MKFRGKKVVMGILLSVLLLPGEVTLTSTTLPTTQTAATNTECQAYWRIGTTWATRRYASIVLLIFVVIISIGPFLWQLSTSLKSVNENIYSFPPHLIPQECVTGQRRQHDITDDADRGDKH
jgi:ABC-type glycerol-3-phosphate transport system permease component